MNRPRLILASSSPRRQELLRDAGFVFEIVPADIDESDVPPKLSPGDLAEYLARRKSEVIAPRYPQDVTLGADTVVAFADHIVSKPADLDDARRMLRLLSNTVHSVVTGVSVVCPARSFSRHARVISTVHMRALSDAEIEAYLATNQWQGKAGGYGIQDPDPFVTRSSGDQTNIVGLPMETVIDLLREVDVVPVAKI